MKIVFTGGGTGGHIYPGLAVVEELKSVAAKRSVQIEVFWIGSSAGIDRSIVESSKSDNNNLVSKFYGIPSGKFRRYFSFQNLLDIFKIICGFFCSLFILLKIKPCALFSKGGFVSVPPCIAAMFLKIPVFTHECDFTPGLATRIDAKAATAVFVSYNDTKHYLHSLGGKVVVTGNPVRPVFYEASAERGKRFLELDNETESTDAKKPLLLVLGGSQGAMQINTLVENNLDWLLRSFVVVHQTGEQATDVEYSKKTGYKRYTFIHHEMPDVIAAADVVLSRAGANSLWECATLGKPMILIPLCGSGTRGDQVDNASYFAMNDAALALIGEQADDSGLKGAINMFFDKDIRSRYGQAAKALIGDTMPAHKIAELLLEYVSR